MSREAWPSPVWMPDDFGKEDYGLPGYFALSADRRWKYYRLNNRSHNTLVINNQIQILRAKCKVIAYHSTPERVGAIVDMTDAYKGQTQSAKRGIEMLGRRVVHVRDELTGVNGEVRWAMVTEAEIELSGNDATLTQNGKTLRAEILTPADARFRNRLDQATDDRGDAEWRYAHAGDKDRCR